MKSDGDDVQDISRRALLKQATAAGVYLLGATLTWRAKRLLGASLSENHNNKNHFDVIVLGLGCMGASTCSSLAANGAAVLGIERYETVPHNHGESHGDTKVIRKAYFEGDVYVPLIRRAYDQWHEIELVTGKKIIQECGVLAWGPRQAKPGEESIVRQIEGVSRRQGIETHLYDGNVARKRWPMYERPNFPGNPYEAIFEPGGGFLDVDLAMKSFIELAKKRGATLKFAEQVLEFSVDDKRVCVKTNKGTYSANQIIVTGGPWSYDLLVKHLELPLTIEPRVQLWFPAKNQHSLDGKKVPVFFYDLPDPFGFIYGFPMLPSQRGIKVSGYVDGFEARIKSPDILAARADYQQALGQAIETTKRFVERYLPYCDACHGPYRIEPCNYTMAPGSHWILDKVPSHPRLNIGCGFSGHGFKCAPAIGEVLANLALGHKLNPAYDLGFFSIASAKRRALNQK